MNITVLAVGTKMPRWVDEAVGEYAKRFGRDVAYTLKEIKPEKRGAGVNAAQGMAAEEKRILEAIPQGAFLIVLDERGKAPTSVELAEHVRDRLVREHDLRGAHDHQFPVERLDGPARRRRSVLGSPGCGSLNPAGSLNAGRFPDAGPSSLES